VAELTYLRTMTLGLKPTNTSKREGDGVWNVNNNKAETEKAVVADGFFNAAGLADFVSTKGRSISKMLDY
jgi:hypothetical protein